MKQTLSTGHRQELSVSAKDGVVPVRVSTTVIIYFGTLYKQLQHYVWRTRSCNKPEIKQLLLLKNAAHSMTSAKKWGNVVMFPE